MVAVCHLASSVHLGSFFIQAGWLQHFKGHVAGWHTTAGVQLGLQTAHQCLLSAKASLESLQMITLNFQRWKEKRELPQAGFATTLYFFVKMIVVYTGRQTWDWRGNRWDWTQTRWCKLSTFNKWNIVMLRCFFKFVVSHLKLRILFPQHIQNLLPKQQTAFMQSTVSPLCNSMWHLYKNITVYTWHDQVIVHLCSEIAFEELCLASWTV